MIGSSNSILLTFILEIHTQYILVLMINNVFSCIIHMSIVKLLIHFVKLHVVNYIHVYITYSSVVSITILIINNEATGLQNYKYV